MAHRREHLCSASQLWLPHPALCVVPPECFWGLCVWSGAVGSKSGKLRNVADHDREGEGVGGEVGSGTGMTCCMGGERAGSGGQMYHGGHSCGSGETETVM